MKNNEELLKKALMQRGQKISQLGSHKDVFLPQDNADNILLIFEEILYDLMLEPSFRAGLRDWSYGRTKNQKIEDYLTKCEGFNFPRKTQNRYSGTFEWFICEVFKREFNAKASGFGIRLKDASPSDEFDCLAILDNGLIYAECKTGRDDFKKQVKKFVQRDAEVSATYSMLILDRDYIFNKNNDQPLLNHEEAKKLGIISILKVEISNVTLYRINAVDNRYFFVFGGMKNLVEKIRYVIRYITLLNDSDGRKEPLGFNVSVVPWV
jgi:hypothetical protein